jgi:ATP-dependent DNA helicase RecQ
VTAKKAPAKKATAKKATAKKVTAKKAPAKKAAARKPVADPVVEEVVRPSEELSPPEPPPAEPIPELEMPAIEMVPGTFPASAVAQAARRLGIEKLHAEQELALKDILAGRDVLMILPTGFGKSACYQIPSMVLPKPVVVVSPLLALLRDQQVKLDKRGVPCIRLDGSVRGKARREMLERIARGGPLLVMTTPETLGTEDATKALTASGIGLAAVDEAHCISEWGHDFRPSYLRLGMRLEELGAPPVLALTATATERVRETIVHSLAMRDPALVASSPHRSNLAFEVLHCEGDRRLRVLMRLIKRLRRPGIVYCATRREVDAVYVALRRFQIPSYRYHGGMTSAERDGQQKKFMRPRHRSVMVATNAFGLGIDKRDIRYILHFQAPASLEQYVQEAGRGGRDGRKSNCILLSDPSDRSIHEALLSTSRVRPDQLYRLGRALAAWSAEGRNPTLQALAVSANLGPRITSALLTRVEEAGLVERDRKEVRILGAHHSIENDTRMLAGLFETLRTQDSRRLDSLAEYAASTGCRAMFLREYFGEEGGPPCELCDVCRGQPTRPASFFAPLAAPEPEKKKRPARRARKRRGRGSSRRRRKRGKKTASPPA